MPSKRDEAWWNTQGFLPPSLRTVKLADPDVPQPPRLARALGWLIALLVVFILLGGLAYASILILAGILAVAGAL